METDFLIIGSGIAGMSLALKLSAKGKVILITKKELNESSSFYAQGGIASVFSENDSFESHIQDTLDAGDGLCKKDVVEVTVKEGPDRVRELIELGVHFRKREENNHWDYDLTKEGGHRARRILHAGDATGAEIIQTLSRCVKENPNIQVLNHHSAIDLITEKSIRKNKKAPTKSAKDTCFGAYVLNSKNSSIHTISAHFTILATGGAGKVYLYTTNPDTSTGDGIAMAARAGARVGNMEFMQFHPTCLFLKNSFSDDPRAKSFLISEALRGEGGVLINHAGVAFMNAYHPMGNLAPRDVVARAIDSEIKKAGADCVFLDMRSVEQKHPGFLQERFPNIFSHCLKFGIDMTKEPIPVVPAAHYTCGGVVSDLHGESTIQALFAIGETAHTGLHGANRLASNSLLEGIVFAHRAFEEISSRFHKNRSKKTLPNPLPEWDSGMAVPMEEKIDIHHAWRELRTLIWNYVGIVRSNKRLRRARARLELIQFEVQEHYWNYLLTPELIELRNLVTIADLIVTCALLRKESRGLHYNLDFPFKDDVYFNKDTLL